jgi:hypothetical protein
MQQDKRTQCAVRCELSTHAQFAGLAICATCHLTPMFEQSRGVKRGREQDSDPMLDRHGNAATPKLFVNKLPHNIKEDEISALFSKLDGFVSVQLGNKVLMAVCIARLPLILNDSIDLIVPSRIMNDD